jgi:hypothetical protein
MARTQQINYGNAIALPVTVGAVYTPTIKGSGAANTKAANELFPDRSLTQRIGAWVRNLALNNMTITAPSGSQFQLRPGEIVSMQQGFFFEDGAYTITGTAADTFSFWEAY